MILTEMSLPSWQEKDGRVKKRRVVKGGGVKR